MGTWDLPLNGNAAIIDTMVGGVTSISTTGGTIILNASQVANGTISVSGALTGNVLIQFPAVQGWWSIENLTTNSTSFFVSVFPAGATQSVCAPPGEIVDIQINGTVAKYRNLGRVGSLMEWAGSTVPNWILNCTIPPYLNLDGSTFSAVTYPQLASLIGGTTLPDSRGRGRIALNQGTGRTSSASGVNGDINFSGGGADTITLNASQIPSITSSVTVTGGGAVFPINVAIGDVAGALILTAGAGTTPSFHFPQSGSGIWGQGSSLTGSAASNNTGGAAHGNVQPTYVAGLTLVRAG